MEVKVNTSKLDKTTKQKVAKLSKRKNADLDALTQEYGITRKDIYNWRSLYANGKSRSNGINGHQRRKKTPTRRYTSADRGRVVELERQLGEAYVKIHKLQEYIIEKLI
jgi:transposase-like protein